MAYQLKRARVLHANCITATASFGSVTRCTSEKDKQHKLARRSLSTGLRYVKVTPPTIGHFNTRPGQSATAGTSPLRLTCAAAPLGPEFSLQMAARGGTTARPTPLHRLHSGRRRTDCAGLRRRPGSPRARTGRPPLPPAGEPSGLGRHNRPAPSTAAPRSTAGRYRAAIASVIAWYRRRRVSSKGLCSPAVQ